MKSKKSAIIVSSLMTVMLLFLTAFAKNDVRESEYTLSGDIEKEVVAEETDRITASSGTARTLYADVVLQNLLETQQVEIQSQAIQGQETSLSVNDDVVLTADELKEIYAEGIFLVTVKGSTALNIREEASADSDWVGKMFEGSGGRVLEVSDGWSLVQSGKVTGWVCNDYILTGDEVANELMTNYELLFEVTSDALKVRSEPTTEAENKIRAIYGGETYQVAAVQGDWVQIEYAKDKYGWVAAEHGTIHYEYEDAMSKKEYADYLTQKNRINVSTTTRSSTAASTDDLTLLACLIQCEAGSYEGMLAVANVVINRVNSSKYPNSISGVIYAAGQFSPVSSGKLDTRLSKGPSSTAVQAASDALNGTNNIGSFVHFRSSKGADLAAYSSYTIVGGNVFH